MKVLIIEDEKLAADHLTGLVERYDNSIEVQGIIRSVQKGVEWFAENRHPDLAFLDIHLADGLSFEIFEKTEVRCPVIFTTAYNEYALRAFKVNSVDYLLKPIDFDELKAALDKFERHRGQFNLTGYREVIENVMGMLSDNHKQRFIVKVGERIRSLHVSQIHYFYSMEKATFMHTSDDHNYVVDYSLDQVEKMLDPGKFFRINRKYLISMDAIKDIIAYSNSRLKIELSHSQDMDAIVAREKITRFKEWLDQ